MELNRLVKAFNFAAQKHRNQRRKNSEKTPYINHPVEVVLFLTNAGITDVNILMAAVLHDTVEDTGTKYEELVTEFGDDVAETVMECTDDKSLDKVERKKLQIEHASHISRAAKLVKLSDKLSNMKDLMYNPPTNWSKEEILGYVVWSFFVIENLKGAKGLNPYLENELSVIFDNFGVTKMDTAERLSILEEYYSGMDKKQ